MLEAEEPVLRSYLLRTKFLPKAQSRDHIKSESYNGRQVAEGRHRVGLVASNGLLPLTESSSEINFTNGGLPDAVNGSPCLRCDNLAVGFCSIIVRDTT
jgi:hypothetical protein